MRRVVTLFYCDAPDCRGRTNSMVSLQFRKKQGWTFDIDRNGDATDYCPEHQLPELHEDERHD
jgi:hypothetical protein